MKKRILSLLLALVMLIPLCACGSQTAGTAGDAAGSAANAGDTQPETGEQPPEATPEPPKPFVEEHALSYSMQLSSTQAGDQYPTDEGDTLTPDFCMASEGLVSLDRSEPDEENYVTYTFVSEGCVQPWGIYTDADGDGASFIFGISDYTLFDRYTGTVIPGRETMNDDHYAYTAEFTWDGVTYSVSRSLTVYWDGWTRVDGETLSGTKNFHVEDHVRVPADYDGLTLAWYCGEPEKNSSDDYELDLEQHILCEDDPSKLSDYRCVSIGLLEEALGGGGTETPAPAAFAKEIGDGDYQEMQESNPNSMSLDENGRHFEKNYEKKTKEAFRLRGVSHFFAYQSQSHTWTSTDEGIYVSLEPCQESKDVIDDFVLENLSQDRSIELKVFDGEGKLLGSSGLVGPNMYLTSFPLDSPGVYQKDIDYVFSGTVKDDSSNMEVSSVEMNRYQVYRPSFTVFLYIYDAEGNLLTAESLDSINYGNAYGHDWAEIAQADFTEAD